MFSQDFGIDLVSFSDADANRREIHLPSAPLPSRLDLPKFTDLNVYGISPRFSACFHKISARIFHIFWGRCVLQANSPSIGVGALVLFAQEFDRPECLWIFAEVFACFR